MESPWYKRDFRASGFPKAIAAGFVTDQDLISPEDMQRHPYYAEWLIPRGLQWFLGITIRVDGKVWGAAVHGSPSRGPFLADDVDKLMRVRDDIAVAARRVAALGAHRIKTLEKTFASANRGVVALGWSGKIVWSNERAEGILRDADLVRNNRIGSEDIFLDRKLSDLIDSAISYPGNSVFVLPSPLRLAMSPGRVVSIDAIPMPRDFRAALTGAAALVTLHEVAEVSAFGQVLRERFRLTGRELELATHLVAGRSVAEAAETMRLSVGTARQHLKAVLAKTGTRRQAELVALLTRLDG